VRDAPSPRPAVSVVIPTFQRRELVARALESVRAQTFRDYEVIVVDDGSTDGTDEAIARLGMNVRYMHQENQGLSAARNAGIAVANGDLVAFLDSDDRWLPGHLELTTAVFACHPEAVLCSTSPRFEIGGRQEPADATLVDALPALLVENVVGHPSSITVRREALAATGGFNPRFRMMEGWEHWLRLAALGRFAYLQHETIVYAPTPTSITRTGGENGEYLRSLEMFPATIATVAAAADDRRDAPRIRARAAGLATYLAALRAFARDDVPAARRELAAACVALPELSREPQAVANRLALLRFGTAQRLRTFATAADLWPDPHADTALYLRFHAVVLAARLGRWREAARLAWGWPLRATPAFAARSGKLFAKLVRRTLQQRRAHA
jgi:hypothetical protein